MIEETVTLATTGVGIGAVDTGVLLGNMICFVIGILIGWIIARAYAKYSENEKKDE